MIGDRRALGGPDAGVTVVIGAVLVVGAIVSGLVVFRLTVVPQMAERAEAEGIQDAGRAMKALNERILSNMDRSSSAPLPSTIPLQAQAPPLVPAPLGGGSLSFEPGESSTTLSSPVLRIQTVNGTTQLSGSGTGGQWTTIPGSHTLTDVTAVHGLRIKITEPSPSDGDRVRITITDANGDYAGEFSAFFSTNPPDLDLLAETLDPSGNNIFHNHLIEMHQTNWDSDYWINALDELYAFDQMLENAEKPLTLTFSEEGANAEFLIAYEEAAGDGLSVLQGAGKDVPGYAKQFASGPIVFQSENNWFLDQAYEIEQGAIILEQSDGAVFRVDPPFEAEASSSFVKLSHDVPMLDGEDAAVTGAKSAQVSTRTTSTTSIGAIAGQVNVTVTTDHPTLWAEFFEEELTDAGLTSTNCPPADPTSPCQFQVTTTSNTARVEIYGPTATDADPQNPTHDIALEQLRSGIEVQVER